MDTISIFNFNHNGADIDVKLVCFNEFACFSDLWEMTDTHQGGVTVQNPNADRNSYKFAIPLHNTLADYTRDLIKGGTPASEASGAAYHDFIGMLRRDLSASDYGFIVSAKLGDTVLLNDFSLGYSFDYSYHDDISLEDLANEELEKCKPELFEELNKAAEKVINNNAALVNFVAASK